MTDGSQARELGRRALEASGAGRLDEAWALWEQAVALDPRDTDIAIGFTNALAWGGDPSRAATVCARLIEANPDLHMLWLQQGILRNNFFADPQGAIASITEALRRGSDQSIAHRVLAQIYSFNFQPKLMRHHAALAITGADPRGELFLRTRYLSDYEGGADLAQRILADAPDDLETLMALAKSLRMLGRLEQAQSVVARAAEIAPENLEVVLHAGELRLLQGDHRGGWRWLEALANDGEMTRGYPHVVPHLARRWRGEPLAGKRILVAYYAGIGDNLMMARYARDLRAAGAYVAFACRPELFRLLRDLEGADEVIDNWDLPRWEQFDFWVFDYVLPAYLGAAEGRIPAYPGGYLTVPADVAAQWDARLAPSKGRLRVGLCWFSGLHNVSGFDRFVPAEALSPLAELAGVDWVVMQKCGDNPNINPVLPDNLQDYSGAWYDFADSAAIMRRLDLVISVDSSPLHLAGALGVPAWALIPAAPEWRWGLSGEESVWYPGVRIFRQSRLHDWSDVIARVKAELTALATRRVGS